LKISESIAIFELVLRYLDESTQNIAIYSRSAQCYYAENHIGSPRPTKKQRNTVASILQVLNSNRTIGNEMPLRLFRCQNFIEAGQGRICSSKKLRRRALSAGLDDAFG